jgi:hypothetical protein
MSPPSSERDPIAGTPGAPSGHSAEQAALSTHILSVSGTLVGVCLTVIGLIRTVERLKGLQTVEDELLAIDSLTFLFAGLASYLALRSRTQNGYRRLERIADAWFLIRTLLDGSVPCPLSSPRFAASPWACRP